MITKFVPMSFNFLFVDIVENHSGSLALIRRRSQEYTATQFINAVTTVLFTYSLLGL